VTSCPFCVRIEEDRELLTSSVSSVAFNDLYPVSDGHVLVVPRNHVERLESLTDAEWQDLFALVRDVSRGLAAKTGVCGVNIGVNGGRAAGQTLEHAHVHVIPRRRGDVADPRGGVRWVIPHAADYWSKRD
jgi:diadenosine tetraphosphate (Ap4A) HIT family hydrolase